MMTRQPDLERLLRALKNDFAAGAYDGKILIEGGEAVVPVCRTGCYYRLAGSPGLDGVYLCGGETPDLPDGEYDAALFTLAVPPAVTELAADIAAWIAANAVSGFVSESFGGYSYTRAVGSDGLPHGWQRVFRARMAPWRRI